MPPETLDFEEPIGVLMKEIEALSMLPRTDARQLEIDSLKRRIDSIRGELYEHLTPIAAARGAVIVDGNNADDRGDFRPGRQAAREFGVRSPLDEVNLFKEEIRELSRVRGLPTWDAPASACLSSRIPYFSEVTSEKLRTIERAEELVRALGFRVCRVRHLDEGARVEIGRDELSRALEPEMQAAIVRQLQELGYSAVVIDPRGYRLGSLNEGVVLHLSPERRSA